MPKFKVTIALPKYEVEVEADNVKQAKERGQEEFLFYLDNNDIDHTEVITI